MARGPSTFKERDVRAAVRAVKAAGIEVARVEVDTDGKIVIVSGTPETAPRNEWDTVLPS
jgi:hypothetical protein